MNKIPHKTQNVKKEDKQSRLEAALRRNLKRRKVANKPAKADK